MAGRMPGWLPRFSNLSLPVGVGNALDEVFKKLFDSSAALNRAPGDPSEIRAGVAADAGTLSNPPALDDHVHAVDIDGLPSDVGATNAQGNGPGLATVDHTHRLGILAYKGDILGFDGSNPTAIPVGSDGEVLVADSSAATGLSWSSSTEDALLLAWIGL